jgi:DNA-binding transcriptional MerR regulator
MTLAFSRELVKLYYRIGEVSQIVGVQPHVLRYWETEFRTIRPQKSHKGQRVYSRRDVEKLLKVKDLLKNQGFTIAGAKKKLREPEPEAAAEALVEQEVTTAPVQPVSARPPVVDPSRAQMRDALLAIRDDIATMLDDLDAPPRRPKLPSLP